MDALRQYAPEIEPLALEDGAAANQRTDRRILREQFALPAMAQAAHADLLHLTGFAAPLRARVPVVLTVMDLIGMLFPQNFPIPSRFYWSRYLPFTLPAARQIITLSEHTRRDVLRLSRIPETRICVIPPGVDSRFRVIPDSIEPLRARLGLPLRYFLFVSTLEPRKGIDTLLKSFAQVAPAVTEDLVIVGKRGWKYHGLFESVRAYGLDARIHVLDYIDSRDLPGVYNLATGFIFPSRYEGFGLTPLEAMASGAPVVSSNAASLPEVVGDAGILLPPDDVNAFADSMRDLALNPALRAALRERGLARARLFTWERAAHATAELYRACLTDLRAGRA